MGIHIDRPSRTSSRVKASHAARPQRSNGCPLVIFGTGEIAEIAHFYFTHDAARPVAAFTVDATHMRESAFHGLPVVPFEQVEKDFPADSYDLFIATGYRHLNRLRAEKCRQGKEKGYRLATYLSSRATVWQDFCCGENCFILENNVIQPFVRIGDDVFLWSGNHIGHHACIGNDTFIASHVVVSGGVTIGKRCFFGVNAAIHDHLSIGDDCVIGAGSIVDRSLPAGSVLLPSPSRVAPFASHRLRGAFAHSPSSQGEKP